MKDKKITNDITVDEHGHQWLHRPARTNVHITLNWLGGIHRIVTEHIAGDTVRLQTLGERFPNMRRQTPKEFVDKWDHGAHPPGWSRMSKATKYRYANEILESQGLLKKK